MGDTVRLATRGSDLALRQAETVKAAVEGPRHDIELVEVETKGDQVRDALIHELGRIGAFVRALDEQVLAGEVDAAVHSMKDMPTQCLDELVVAGVPERGVAGDVLVTPDGATLSDLRPDAVVGTSSLRRTAFLLGDRPDIVVEGLRGNVDTRVEKLLAPGLQHEHERLVAAEQSGELDDDEPTPEEWVDALAPVERAALDREVEIEYDAIVLAEAGLERSGLLDDVPVEPLPRDSFVPAPGQGALAVVAREGSAVAELVHDRVDDPATRVATTVERTVLAELGGGCVAPIGVSAYVRGAYVHVDAAVASRDGERTVTAARDLPIETHASAARDLAVEMRERGAAEIVADAKER